MGIAGTQFLSVPCATTTQQWDATIARKRAQRTTAPGTQSATRAPTATARTARRTWTAPRGRPAATGSARSRATTAPQLLQHQHQQQQLKNQQPPTHPVPLSAVQMRNVRKVTSAKMASAKNIAQTMPIVGT